MRPFKFRQFADGKFHYWGFLGSEGFTLPIDQKYPSQQFTGLFSKDGKEIWEGDIVQFAHYLNNIIYQGEIWYCADRGQFLIKYFYPNRKDFMNFRFEDIKSETIEVIGNIY